MKLFDLFKANTRASKPKPTRPELVTQLRDAIEAGDSERVLQLVRNGAPLAGEEGEGTSPLHLAAHNGDAAVSEILLDAGASLSARDAENGWTPLHYVAVSRTATAGQVLSLLVSKGADVNEGTLRDDDAALHLAAMIGYPAMIALLLEHGADPNQHDSKGMTPLHFAAKNGETGSVQSLVEGGAIPDERGPQDSTALHWAAIEGYEAVVRYLLDHGADPDPVDARGWTPLFLAAQKGNDSLIDLFVSAGAQTKRVINGQEASVLSGSSSRES